MRPPNSCAGACIELACLVAAGAAAHADEPTEETGTGKFSYGKKGVEFDDGTGNNFLWFGVRLQTRWASTRVTEDELPGGAEKEFTLGANWFFNGHRNKLTLDVSRMTRREAPETDTSNRARLQWDWSF